MQTHVQLLLNVDEDPRNVLRDPQIDRLREQGVDEIVATNMFHNWGGSITEKSLPSGAYLLLHNPQRRDPCSMFYKAPMVLVDGRVTACGCANSTGGFLILGDCVVQSLAAIWRGDRFQALEKAFGTDELPAVCQSCNYDKDSQELLNDPRLTDFRVGESALSAAARLRS